ncbi:MAG: hypothetical protein Q8O98_02040, partial [bacterium]|nr:hypothetical protein [bacterium]
MKLLIVTQRVDKDDPVLGFFHEWVQEFSSHCEKVTVVCLGTGDYSFPPNVKVLSLGKERGASKLEYLVNFYRYVLRVDYTHVFVHMNQEYVLLAGDLWRLMGKKVALWRNHPDGSLLTNLAVALAHKVFCTSPSSYTSQFKKTKIMPAGIDVDSYEESKTDLSTQGKVLFFGRLSSVKNVHVFIEALKILDERGIVFHADIIGSPTDEIGVAYEKELHIQGTKLTERG